MLKLTWKYRMLNWFRERLDFVVVWLMELRQMCCWFRQLIHSHVVIEMERSPHFDYPIRPTANAFVFSQSIVDSVQFSILNWADQFTCVRSMRVSSMPSLARAPDSANVNRAGCDWCAWCYEWNCWRDMKTCSIEACVKMSVEHTIGWGELTSLKPSARREAYSVGVEGTMLSPSPPVASS